MTVQQILDSPTSIGVWNLVPDRSTIGFTCKSMWGLVSVKGRFHQFSGVGEIADGQRVSGRIDVKAASLDTKLRKRDDDLRSADFFDVTRFPDIRVVVTGTGPIDGDNVDVQTQLSVKDTTAAVPLRTKVTVLDDGAVRLIARATIDRKEFGVDGNLIGMVGDKATVLGDLVFTRG